MQGDEPNPDDWLLWVVITTDYWCDRRNNASSNVYKKPKFSAFVEKMQDAQATLKFARAKWGEKPYGIIRLKYSDVKECGFKALYEEEFGIKAHVNVFPDPTSNKGKQSRANAMCECSQVVRPFGMSLDSP